jgi:hypothetical protein
MKKVILTLAVPIMALVAAPGVYAQQDTAGEARAAPSKPATKDEKKAARAKRQSTGKEVAKKDEGRMDDAPNAQGVAKGNTKEEKAAAKTQRKAAGTAAEKAPKDPTATGPN